MRGGETGADGCVGCNKRTTVVATAAPATPTYPPGLEPDEASPIAVVHDGSFPELEHLPGMPARSRARPLSVSGVPV